METPDDRLGFEQTVAEQLAVKWPLIELQTCLLWSNLLCKPLLGGGTLACACVCVAESEHTCKYHHGAKLKCSGKEGNKR